MACSIVCVWLLSCTISIVCRAPILPHARHPSAHARKAEARPARLGTLPKVLAGGGSSSFYEQDTESLNYIRDTGASPAENSVRCGEREARK